jgi:hypothetical protein
VTAPTQPRKRATKPTPEPPRGEARIPERSQGWYRDKETGQKLRSVTTLLGQGFPKPGLMFWSANLTAQDAMENLPYLINSSLHPEQREAAYDWLRKGHIRKKDERGDIGTAVHDVVEAIVLESPLPESVLADPEMAPYLENFLQFVKDWEVTFEASEMVVANYTHCYAGRLDYMFYSPVISAALKLPADTLYMGDTKTGGELDEKGVYPEAGLQMAGYRRAEYCWMRDGSKVPMPLTHSTGIVLHLRPEGVRVVPLNCGDDMFEVFLDVYKVAEFERVLSKSVVGAALVLPTDQPQGDAA